MCLSTPRLRLKNYLTQLNGFSKLDSSSAYLQVFLDEESRQYVTINTDVGLFLYIHGLFSAYKRLVSKN